MKDFKVSVKFWQIRSKNFIFVLNLKFFKKLRLYWEVVANTNLQIPVNFYIKTAEYYLKIAKIQSTVFMNLMMWILSYHNKFFSKSKKAIWLLFIEKSDNKIKELETLPNFTNKINLITLSLWCRLMTDQKSTNMLRHSTSTPNYRFLRNLF